MNTKIKQNIKAIILGLVLTLGLSYAVADFTGPPSGGAPICPPETPACNAPIHVGGNPALIATKQTKTGTLLLHDLIASKFTLAAGTPTAGKVLTALDTNGTVGWASPSGGGAYNSVSSEYNAISPASSGGTTRTQMSPATPQYPFCFLTKNYMNTEGGFIGSCSIGQNNGNWELSAYSTGGGSDRTSCSARCVGFNVAPTNPTVSCTIASASTLATVSTLQNGEPYTLTATPLGSSGYTYKFTGQSSASPSNVYTSYTLVSGTFSPNVVVYDSAGLTVETYSCGTATVDNNRNTYIEVQKNVGATGYESCPNTSISRSGTLSDRTLRAKWPVGANTSGAAQDWYKQVSGAFSTIGSGQTYAIPSIGGPETLIIKYVILGTGIRGERICTINITN